MNQSETRQVLALFRGAWPNSKSTDESVEMWADVLSTVEYEHGLTVARKLAETNLFHPAIVEFNTALMEHRREIMRNAEEDDRYRFAIRCDSSGWLDKGQGLEPCPTCNPWARDRWDRGLWHMPARPPTDYAMPQPCKRHDTGRLVSRSEGLAIARAAYIDACREEGRPPTDRVLRSFNELATAAASVLHRLDDEF